MGRRAKLATVVLLLACLSGVAAPSALAHPNGKKPPKRPTKPAAATVTFGIGSASATGLDGQPALTFQSSPGGQSLNHVAVVNYAATRQTLNVYPVDATNAADGSIAFADASAARTGAAAWLSVQLPNPVSAITLRPHATRVLPISLVVPKNATPGDHVAAVIASLTSTARTKKGEKVNLEQRVALRVYIRVSGPALPALRIQNLHVNYHNAVGLGSATVSFAVHNSGNISLGGTVQVQMGGVLGPAAVARGPDLPLLLPGGTFHETVAVHGVWPVFYDTASVRVQPLAQAGAVDPVLPEFSASSRVVTIPWLVVGLLVLIAAAVLARQLIWVPRRQRIAPARHQLAGSRA
jgi:hypothetical protein